MYISNILSGCSHTSSSSGTSSRRLSNNDSGLVPDSPVSLPLTSRSPRTLTHRSSSLINNTHSHVSLPRASIEDLSDFLSKMDSSIASNTKASISLIKSSNIEEKQCEEGVNTSLNNTHTRLSDSAADTDEEIIVTAGTRYNMTNIVETIWPISVDRKLF